MKGKNRAMRRIKQAIVVVLSIVLFLAQPCALFARETSFPRPKYALVIGNSDYTGLEPLANPVNDANDVAAVLGHLGFTVDKVLNGTLEEMEDAVQRLMDRLRLTKNNYCFFFYAGHGIQSGGENYLIPVDAKLPSENHLRSRAVSVQQILDDLNETNNELNVVVLDACRDNPFGWSRSASRGLGTIISQPSNSIVVYSTGAGSSVTDGLGRNSIFTGSLIHNLATPGIEVTEVFRRTGQEVTGISSNYQVPAIYSQFFEIAFLGETPDDLTLFRPGLPGATVIIGGSKESEPAKLWSVGASAGTCFVEPWLTATARGTIAPFKYSFLELGIEFGFISGLSYLDYYSFCPFAHAAFYWPFHEKIGAYLGAGCGYMIANYIFSKGSIIKTGLAGDAIIGINLFNIIDVSYTLRTDFNRIIGKASIGYTYIF